MMFLFNLGDENLGSSHVNFHGCTVPFLGICDPSNLSLHRDPRLVPCRHDTVLVVNKPTTRVQPRLKSSNRNGKTVEKWMENCGNPKVDSFKAFVSTETADFEGKGMIAFIMTRVFSLL